MDADSRAAAGKYSAGTPIARKKALGIRPLFHATDASGINVAKARQQLKYGLIELHRGVNMLHSFGVLNNTGVIKILKKHDKAARWDSKEDYLQKMETLHFRQFDTLQRMRDSVIDAYAGSSWALYTIRHCV
jgi:hypothetical protein